MTTDCALSSWAKDVPFRWVQGANTFFGHWQQLESCFRSAPRSRADPVPSSFTDPTFANTTSEFDCTQELKWWQHWLRWASCIQKDAVFLRGIWKLKSFSRTRLATAMYRFYQISTCLRVLEIQSPWMVQVCFQLIIPGNLVRLLYISNFTLRHTCIFLLGLAFGPLKGSSKSHKAKFCIPPLRANA